MNFQQPSFYYISSKLNVSSLIPRTPNTNFELILYFNKENSLNYLNYPVLEDYRQYYIIEPRQTITDVAVFSSPVLNQVEFESTVNFDNIAVVLRDSLSNDPSQVIPEAFFNSIQNPIISLDLIYCAFLDPEGVFIYTGGAGAITKFNASTFQVVDIYPVTYTGLSYDQRSTTLYGGTIDKQGTYAYFVTFFNNTSSTLLKYDTQTFTQVASIAVPFCTGGSVFPCPSLLLIDDDNQFLYIGSRQSPARLAKINLSTFTVDSTLTFNSGEDLILSGFLTPSGFGYFAVNTFPAKIVRVDLNTMTRTGVVTLNSGENSPLSAVYEPSTNYGYFSAYDNFFAKVVKIDTTTAPNPTRISANANSFLLGTGNLIFSMAIVPSISGTNFIYACYGDTADRRLVQIDISGFNPVPITSITLDYGNWGYNLVNLYIPSIQRLFIVSNDERTSLVSNPALTSPTTVLQISPSPMQVTQSQFLTQSVLFANASTVDSTGQFMYIGSRQITFTRSRTAIAVKVDLSNFAIVGTIYFLPTPTIYENIVHIVLDHQDQFGYFIFKEGASVPRIIKVNLGSFTISAYGSLINDSTIKSVVIDRTNTFLYYTQTLGSTNTIVKVNLATLTVVSSWTLPISGTNPSFSETNLYIDPNNQYMYTSSETGTNACGVVYKFDLSTFSLVGRTSLAVFPTTFFVESSTIAFDPQGRFAITAGSATVVVTKLELSSSSLPVVVNQVYQPTLPGGTTITAMLMDPTGKYAYIVYNSLIGSNQARVFVTVVDTDTMEMTRIFLPESIRLAVTLIKMDPQGRFLYLIDTVSLTKITRINLTNSLLSGFSTESPSNLQNNTEIVDVDYISQVAKLRGLGQNRQKLLSSRYVALYVKGQTGEIVLPESTPLTIHTRIKVYPN